MKRITQLLTVTAAVSVLGADASAQDLRVLESRVLSIEQRLSSLETRLSSVIQPQNVTLPAPSFVSSKPAITVPAPTAQTYVIREGDSLGGIARNFGIPRQALLTANKLAEGQPIYIGEALKIPAQPNNNPIQAPAPGNGILHTVKPGDTLSGLARRYNSTVQSIKQTNQLPNDLIGVGQKLVIPASSSILHASLNQQPSGNDVVMTSSKVHTPKANSNELGPFEYDNPLLRSNETYGYYAVQNGDNLYALARDFFTTLPELQRLNNLGNTVIHPGSELVVPTSKYNAYHQKIAHN